MAPPDSRPDPLPALERRLLAGELRAVEYAPPDAPAERRQRRVAGWASKFLTPVSLGNFDEVMTATAFDGLAGTSRNIKLLKDHRGTALASVRAGTLSLRVVPGQGLEFSAALPEGAEGDEVWNHVNARNLDGASIGYVCKRDRWEARGGRPTRLVEDADVFEVSLTGVPAMPEAAVVVEARALDRARDMLIAAGTARATEAQASVDAAHRRTQLAHAWATFADAMETDRDWRPSGGPR